MFETDANLNNPDKWDALWNRLLHDEEYPVHLVDDNEHAKDELLDWLDFGPQVTTMIALLPFYTRVNLLNLTRIRFLILPTIIERIHKKIHKSKVNKKTTMCKMIRLVI